MWQNLPREIIHNILSYDPTLKLRAGKWMGQIPKTDPRYQLLKTIPPKYYYRMTPRGNPGSYHETYVMFPDKKYLICRIENDFYFSHDIVLHYLYCGRGYVLHTLQ